MIDVGNGKSGARRRLTPGAERARSRARWACSAASSPLLRKGDLVEVNLVRGLKRYKKNRRERCLSAVELGKLGDLLSAQEKDASDPRPVAIIRLLLLTGARKNEIARLRWSEVDPEKGADLTEGLQGRPQGYPAWRGRDEPPWRGSQGACDLGVSGP